jgi:pimeloyl-ACP methyl ester carboxylesterase
MDLDASYPPRRPATSRFVTARGLSHHLLEWGSPALATPERPTLVMLHGWMDVAASFQFVVDALPTERHVIALDWRGFGATDSPAADTYFFPEYLGDLELVLDALFGVDRGPIDLLGHSMGGNVAMLYSGVRPDRVRRLVNLEGFGMPRSRPEQAPKRVAFWLVGLKKEETTRPTTRSKRCRAPAEDQPALAQRPARWLAGHGPAVPGENGAADTWHLLAADHKRSSPIMANVDEWLEFWKRITAPVLWIEGDRTDLGIWWGDRYTKAEFHERLNVVRQVARHIVAPAGHMLHHDRPEDVARLVESFLA